LGFDLRCGLVDLTQIVRRKIDIDRADERDLREFARAKRASSS